MSDRKSGRGEKGGSKHPDHAGLDIYRPFKDFALHSKRRGHHWGFGHSRELCQEPTGSGGEPKGQQGTNGKSAAVTQVRNGGGLASEGSSARGKRREGVVLKIGLRRMFLKCERKSTRNNSRFFSGDNQGNGRPITNWKDTGGEAAWKEQRRT